MLGKQGYLWNPPHICLDMQVRLPRKENFKLQHLILHYQVEVQITNTCKGCSAEVLSKCEIFLTLNGSFERDSSTYTGNSDRCAIMNALASSLEHF